MEIKEIISRKAEIIALKKATLKKCEAVEVSHDVVVKFDYETNDTDTEITRKIIANTYFWLDSHGDVHIPSIFTKSINENKTKVLHLHDHIYELQAKIGQVIDIEEKEMNLTDLGINQAGTTIVLMPTSRIRKDLNASMFGQYKRGEINQHSVGMNYVNLFLAVNDSQYEDEYKTWLKYYPNIINKEKALEKGYFWAVTEAKLIEFSAVIKGSNEITPTIEPSNKEEEPSNHSTEKDDTLELLEYINKNINL